ncbi:MAG: quinolinate synthase NadA [Dehalococcoidales bacterium]|nr:quinolinate synthase NadA [Dehalococcoidales bacterium]
MLDESEVLVKKINELKARRKAVILVHNYQLGEVQDIADFLGDSLELSRKAAGTDAEVIVFCGVHFMAETASILCPDKTIILPEFNAGCLMADMITASALREKKNEHPAAAVVCYVNSPAEVKAESDICCTSANAIEVVNSLASNEILFVPDQNLGHYVSTKTSKKMILWPGYCPTHARITPEDIKLAKARYPEAKVMVHPECRPETIAVADEVVSTSGMVNFVHRTSAREIIVGTEIGFIYRLRKENPDITYVPVSEQAICPHMKLITLDKVLQALEEMSPVVKVPEHIRLRALGAVNKMIEAGKK